jgi:hypothetical protein
MCIAMLVLSMSCASDTVLIAFNDLSILPVWVSSNSRSAQTHVDVERLPSSPHTLENVSKLLLRSRFVCALRLCRNLLDDFIHSQIFQLVLELLLHIVRDVPLVFLHCMQDAGIWQLMATAFFQAVLFQRLGQSIDLALDKCIDQLLDCATDMSACFRKSWEVQ